MSSIHLLQPVLSAPITEADRPSLAFRKTLPAFIKSSWLVFSPGEAGNLFPKGGRISIHFGTTFPGRRRWAKDCLPPAICHPMRYSCAMAVLRGRPCVRQKVQISGEVIADDMLPYSHLELIVNRKSGCRGCMQLSLFRVYPTFSFCSY